MANMLPCTYQDTQPADICKPVEISQDHTPLRKKPKKITTDINVFHQLVLRALAHCDMINVLKDSVPNQGGGCQASNLQ
jgi:hypothetical protein